MHFGRFALYFMLTLSLLMAPLLLADEAVPASKSLEPLQILKDCIQAVQSGDFARYVDHLSKDEQQIQAGYALLLANIMTKAADTGTEANDPGTILLARALKDLVRDHSLSEVFDNQAYQYATQARDQMIGQVSTAVTSASYGANVSNRIPPPAVRERCMTSTGVLKDHRQFLIAVLTEASRPTVVSGDKPAESEPTFDFDEYTNGFSEAKWTIYTRGDHAIAVAASPHAEDRPSTSAPNQLQPVPAQGAQKPSPFNVGFRRIDGVWKIDRLLPVAALSP